MSSEQLEGSFSLNSRRRVFYQYPNGAAPLLGLLSLMETEETDKAEFGWYEDRLDDQKTETAGISATNGPFSASGSDVPATAAGFNIAENEIIRVLVDSTAKFRPRNVLMIRNVPNTGGTLYDIKGVIVTIVSSTKVEIRALKAYTNVYNGDGTGGTTSAVDKHVIVIGSANPEGARSGTGIFLPPKNLLNFTQIFRTAFSFTRTALKAGIAWDKTGIYKSKAKQNCVRHMIEMEKAFLFGHKQEYQVTDQGDDVVERTTGGIWYWLENWETGTPYGVDAATTTNGNQRIFKPNGPMTKAEFKAALAQIFKVTNNVDYAKLCLCGNGFFQALQDFFGNQLQFQTGQVAKGSYGMNITKWETSNGTVYFKTHPLFNQLTTLNYTGMFIDVPMLKYRPLSDSDTILLKNRQENDQDRRKDEWLTEAGLENRMPESHGIIDGLTQITQ